MRMPSAEDIWEARYGVHVLVGNLGEQPGSVARRLMRTVRPHDWQMKGLATSTDTTCVYKFYSSSAWKIALAERKGFIIDIF